MNKKKKKKNRFWLSERKFLTGIRAIESRSFNKTNKKIRQIFWSMQIIKKSDCLTHYIKYSKDTLLQQSFIMRTNF